MYDDLAGWGQPEDIDYIVVTDGEEVNLLPRYSWDGKADTCGRFLELVTKVLRAKHLHWYILTECTV